MIGQRKLLKWTVPGVAHALTFWGFTVLLLTIIEAYGDLFSRTFAIPGIGHWAFIGFIEDLFAVAVLAGLITFAVIRLRSDPHREGRGSRFFGSHTGRGVAGPRHDLAGHRDAAAVPGRADQHGRVPLRPRRVRLPDRGALLWRRSGRGEQRARGGVPPRAGHGRPGVPGVLGVLQAPAHLPGPGERPVLPAAGRARGARADASAAARCWTSRRPTRTPTCSGWARSRTSPGRACWTWPPAPSAGGASRSARPGPPASRCPPSRSSWTCVITRSLRRRTCWRPRKRNGRSCPMRSRPRPNGRWWARRMLTG